MQIQVEALLAQQLCRNDYQVRISGETNNISLYVIEKSEVFVITPFLDIKENVVLKDAQLLNDVHIVVGRNFAIVPHTSALKARLKWPKVLFINLSVVDNFPIPRLSLGVAVLTSYIRRKQKGIVRIIDMQMGMALKDVVHMATSFSPELIGLSVSYGQKFLAFELLSALEDSFQEKKQPLIEVGNILPASSPKEFLTRFPRVHPAFAMSINA